VIPDAVLLLPTLALLLVTPTLFAASSVPDGYRRVAAMHGIPSALFYAVALAESGKRIDGLRTMQPWPWTLNVHGDGHFYPTRRAATAALQEALDGGRTSVDIGLMQVNWKYHGGALGPMEEALDPYRNLDVAATILVTCYRSRGAWWAAVGCYHAPNDRSRAARYRARVRGIWSGLATTG
jgi:soluble lytic murein transglycosylase-like protein